MKEDTARAAQGPDPPGHGYAPAKSAGDIQERTFSIGTIPLSADPLNFETHVHVRPTACAALDDDEHVQHPERRDGPRARAGWSNEPELESRAWSGLMWL